MWEANLISIFSAGLAAAPDGVVADGPDDAPGTDGPAGIVGIFGSPGIGTTGAAQAAKIKLTITDTAATPNIVFFHYLTLLLKF